jgi:hypothetical protein
VLRDAENDWALNQTLSLMSENAAQTGECLYAARRIDEALSDTSVDQWASLAARIEALGDESLANGHMVSARESYLRANNYWRTAEYACAPSHARFTETWRRALKPFARPARCSYPQLSKCRSLSRVGSWPAISLDRTILACRGRQFSLSVAMIHRWNRWSLR